MPIISDIMNGGEDLSLFERDTLNGHRYWPFFRFRVSIWVIDAVRIVSWLNFSSGIWVSVLCMFSSTFMASDGVIFIFSLRSFSGVMFGSFIKYSSSWVRSFSVFAFSRASWNAFFVCWFVVSWFVLLNFW